VTAEINSLLSQPNPMATRQVAVLAAAGGGVPGSTEALKGDPATPGNLEAWFGTVMDRVRQRFTTRMRLWTVAFAFVLAFSTCLDTFALIKTLYSNDNLRTQLADSASQMLKAAQDVQSSQIYTDALNQALKAAGINQTASGIKDFKGALDWIDQNIKDKTQHDNVVSALNQQFASIQTQRISSVSSILSNAGLKIAGWSHWSGDPDQFLGVVVSWLLLCLGAPFWYNTLSSLTSLRPLLAGKQSSKASSPSQ
jgi:hypothetical protein